MARPTRLPELYSEKTINPSLVEMDNLIDIQPSLLTLPQRLTAKKPYESMLDSLANDPTIQKEISLGMRIGFYNICEEIGTGNKVAIKIMDKHKMNEKTQNLLIQEIKAMEQLHHPNIIRLFECVKTTSRIYLIMEYAGYGELYTHINNKGKLAEDDCKEIFAQIVSAISYMHSKNIIHRDIKAENVVLSRPDWIKLADFGFACQVNPDDKLTTFCGSPTYAAPELFKNGEYCGKSVDIWAIGVLLYFMLVGNTPFRGETINNLKQCILRGTYPLPNYLSTSVQRIISQMLIIDPMKRCTIHDVENCNFLKGCKFTKPYIQCNMIPDEKELIENPIALRIHNTLRFYGINEAILEDGASKGIENSVAGIYHIVLHQAQQDYNQKENQTEKYHAVIKEGNHYQH
ncbi:Serine/threonine-protein kinase NIM1 [Dirofilaria immitis]|nr:Serine/threonine-protein kinase NIM1 [Dirofilaria immitis]